MIKIQYAFLIAIQAVIINNIKVYKQPEQTTILNNQNHSPYHWITTTKMRQIFFSNYTWSIRVNNTIKQNPGPNFYTDSPSNVFIDKNGYLNMKITKVNNNWMCSQIGLSKSLGYGSYIFSVDKGFQKIDPLTVFGLFVWQDDTHEIDIQISKWGNSWSNSTQYAIQPFKIQGNLQRFSPRQTNISVVHVFTWNPNFIFFQTFSANNIKQIQKDIGKISSSSNLIHQWIYRGNQNPKPGKQKLFIVFYMSSGKAPINGQQQQIILKQFKFRPLKEYYNINIFCGLLVSFMILYFI